MGPRAVLVLAMMRAGAVVRGETCRAAGAGACARGARDARGCASSRCETDVFIIWTSSSRASRRGWWVGAGVGEARVVVRECAEIVASREPRLTVFVFLASVGYRSQGRWPQQEDQSHCA